jgi:flagellin-like protein
MKLQNLRADEDAVSPVIGVILMVAVTVILAAVIASFVLGMGSTVNASPQTSFSFDYEDGGNGFGPSDGDDSVTIAHESGGELDADRVSVVIDGTRFDVNDFSSWSSEISAGDSESFTDSGYSIEMESGDTIRVVWSSGETDQSTTLSTSTVP